MCNATQPLDAPDRRLRTSRTRRPVILGRSTPASLAMNDSEASLGAPKASAATRSEIRAGGSSVFILANAARLHLEVVTAADQDFGTEALPPHASDESPPSHPGQRRSERRAVRSRAPGVRGCALR